MDRAEEKSLVRRLSRLDDDAWAGFCADFRTPLAQYLRLRFGCDLQRAEEIVQRTFVRCVRSIGSFDPSRGRLGDWLRAVAANEARTYLQGESRPGAGHPGVNGSRAALAAIVDCLDRQPLPEELIERRDTQIMVAECLLELPQRQRQVLVMKYQEEMKVSQIAQNLALSEKAVESLLSRARESFRKALVAKAANAGLTVAEIQP
jgi:RNA polymerase sigma-70 factor, ECF subfamily